MLLLTSMLPVVFTMFFLITLKLIKSEMQEKLGEQILTTITIPANEVKWIEYKKEISINNRLFDIESFSFVNDQYFFTGLFDDEETMLNINFEKDIDERNEKENQLISELFKVLQAIYIGNRDDHLIPPCMQTNYSNLALLNINSPFISVLTPPPQS